MTAQGSPSSCNKPPVRRAALETKTLIAPSSSHIKADSDTVFKIPKIIKTAVQVYHCMLLPREAWDPLLKENKDTMEPLIQNLDCKNRFEI